MNNDSELKVICICNLQWADVRLFLYLFSVPSQPLLLVYLQLKIVKSGIQQSSWRSRQFKIYYRSRLRRDETETSPRWDWDETETWPRWNRDETETRPRLSKCSDFHDMSTSKQKCFVISFWSWTHRQSCHWWSAGRWAWCCAESWCWRPAWSKRCRSRIRPCCNRDGWRVERFFVGQKAFSSNLRFRIVAGSSQENGAFWRK